MNEGLRLASELAVAQTEVSFLHALQRNADSVGASVVKASHLNAPRNCLTPFSVGTETDLYRANEAAVADSLCPVALDPVSSHLRDRAEPIFWDRALYERTGLAYDWEFFASLGYFGGVSVALHITETRHSIVALIWGDAPGGKRPSREALATAIQTMALFAEPTLHRLAGLRDLPEAAGPLSTRELQCLFWASRGLTDDDTGVIAKISPSTVRKHIDSSVRKLGAVNRTHAAVVATRRGLLTANLASL